MALTAWVPFPVGEAPDGLEVVGGDTEPSAEQVARVGLYVVPYRVMHDDTAVFARMPRLEVVQLLSAGYEHLIDRVPAGVTLCSGRGIHSASTAELAMTLILASLRGVPEFVRAQGEQSWQQGVRESLADKVVLIVGYGSIGEALEARLLPFETDVVRVARTARPGVHPVMELAALLPVADVVVLTAPLTEETRGLFDASLLSRMKDGALLVNVGRGGLVDTDALLAELEAGRLRAALDVTDPEPLPPAHRLWTAPNTLITPHVGGPSSAFQPRAERLVREQLRRYAAGEPLLNVVPPRP